MTTPIPRKSGCWCCPKLNTPTLFNDKLAILASAVGKLFSRTPSVRLRIADEERPKDKPHLLGFQIDKTEDGFLVWDVYRCCMCMNYKVPACHELYEIRKNYIDNYLSVLFPEHRD